MRTGVLKVTLAVATVMAWAAFLFLDSLWNACLAQAVSDATRTYGEMYGPLTFFRPVSMYLAFGLSLTGAVWLGIGGKAKKL